jgi:alanine racemase
VLLEGAHAPEDLAVAAREGFEVVVHDAVQLAMLRVHGGARLRCWLKVDTGMHRLGFAPKDARAVHAELAALPGVASVALMTHLACSDERDGRMTRRQLAAFDAFADLPGPRSIANSAGVLGHPEAHADWIRPGLALYGVSPFGDDTGAEHGLKAAMTVSTRLLSVKTVRMGESVGYGARSTAPEDMPVGIAAIGYGDGYPRHAPAGTPALVNGRRVPLIGRVSMDMIAVDLRSQPSAAAGDPVELWGAALPVEEIARAAGMIPYELLCGVTQRVRHEAV